MVTQEQALANLGASPETILKPGNHIEGQTMKTISCHTWVVLIGVAALVLMGVGCGTSADKGSASHGSHGKHDADAGAVSMPQSVSEAMTDGGTYFCSWTSEPSPVPLNKFFSFTLSVFEADKTTPADIGEAKVTFWMPDHMHGVEGEVPKTKTVTGKKGVYVTEGLQLHMPGHWEAQISLKGAGGDDKVHMAIYPQ